MHLFLLYRDDCFKCLTFSYNIYIVYNFKQAILFFSSTILQCRFIEHVHFFIKMQQNPMDRSQIQGYLFLNIIASPL